VASTKRSSMLVIAKVLHAVPRVGPNCIVAVLLTVLMAGGCSSVSEDRNVSKVLIIMSVFGKTHFVFYEWG
jgi:hypothetical protein